MRKQRRILYLLSLLAGMMISVGSLAATPKEERFALTTNLKPHKICNLGRVRPVLAIAIGPTIYFSEQSGSEPLAGGCRGRNLHSYSLETHEMSPPVEVGCVISLRAEGEELLVTHDSTPVAEGQVTVTTGPIKSAPVASNPGAAPALKPMLSRLDRGTLKLEPLVTDETLQLFEARSLFRVDDLELKEQPIQARFISNSNARLILVPKLKAPKPIALLDIYENAPQKQYPVWHNAVDLFFPDTISWLDLSSEGMMVALQNAGTEEMGKVGLLDTRAEKLAGRWIGQPTPPSGRTKKVPAAQWGIRHPDLLAFTEHGFLIIDRSPYVGEKTVWYYSFSEKYFYRLDIAAAILTGISFLDTGVLTSDPLGNIVWHGDPGTWTGLRGLVEK